MNHRTSLLLLAKRPGLQDYLAILLLKSTSIVGAFTDNELLEKRFISGNAEAFIFA